MIRTKIVATMGPASSDVESLRQLFEAGVDVCRVNFSHGSLDSALTVLRNIREAAISTSRPIAILGDLCGPKIRLGKVADVDGLGGMPIKTGGLLTIQREAIVGTDGRVSSTYAGLVDDVRVGDGVLVEDGMLRFVCVEKTADRIVCQCTAGGVLKSSKGINLPSSSVNLPSMTERDWECVDWAVDNHLDYLALSFVRKAQDITDLREYLRDKVSDIHLVAKIEKAEALQEIDAIIDASDGLMVARGDLGVEMDVAQVPIIQKDLIYRCGVAGKPVIVATQMLQSMIENSSPTRAEVSDVANAIIDGTDAVMLSGETSVGKFPIGSVLTMSHVAQVTEEYLTTRAGSERRAESRTVRFVRTNLTSGAMARGALQIVNELAPKLVVVWTTTGATARVFSKHRFPVPIIGLSSDHRVLRRMALMYGVIAQEMPAGAEMNELIRRVDELVIERKFAAPSDRVLIVAGWSPAMPGTMNGMVVHTVGQQWIPMPTPKVLREFMKAERE
jgi:pyruvate kinase